MSITEEQEQTMTWEQFVDLFERHFISGAVRTEKMVELCRIQMKDDEAIEDYDDRFLSLCRFVDRHMPDEKKVALYQAGLNRHFRHKVMAHNFTTYQAASDSARSIQAAYKADMADRKSTRLNSSHSGESRMPSSA